MGPGRRRTRSAGIIPGTGVQEWTVLVNLTLPYLTLPLISGTSPGKRILFRKLDIVQRNYYNQTGQ